MLYEMSGLMFIIGAGGIGILAMFGFTNQNRTINVDHIRLFMLMYILLMLGCTGLVIDYFLPG